MPDEAPGEPAGDDPSRALSTDEIRGVERMLADAWGEPVELAGAEVLWERWHVVRLTTADGRTAILKRPRAAGDAVWHSEMTGLVHEWASLELLDHMPLAVAPRLLASDIELSLLLLEELPAGPSLADELDGDDPAAAEAALVAYAVALAEVHAWSRGRRALFEERLRERGAILETPPVASPSVWAQRVAKADDSFGSAAERAEIVRLLAGPPPPDDDGRTTFVHSDPCPDNVLIAGGRCRILDFERSGWGSPALDAAYLVAPFPSCWYFGTLPDPVAAAARGAYRATAEAAGMVFDDAWEAELAATLAAFLIVRVPMFATPDEEWGTTSYGPRFVAWAEAFLAAPGAAAFPRLVADATALRDRLVASDAVTDPVGYPALPLRGSGDG